MSLAAYPVPMPRRKPQPEGWEWKGDRRSLAEALGISEEELARYEGGEYPGAYLARKIKALTNGDIDLTRPAGRPPKPPQTPLAKWMAEHAKDRKWLADLLLVSDSTARQIENGYAPPKREAAIRKLEAVTGLTREQILYTRPAEPAEE